MVSEEPEERPSIEEVLKKLMNLKKDIISKIFTKKIGQFKEEK